MQVCRFTKPEMEAALQLIQLTGQTDDDYVSGNGFCNSSGAVLPTSMKRRREIVCDHGDESQGSNTSGITSAVRTIIGSRFEAEDGDDVAGNERRKRKKFRSIVEIYEISRKFY